MQTEIIFLFFSKAYSYRNYFNLKNIKIIGTKSVEPAKSGQNDEALDLTNQGIKHDANNPNAWQNKGVILFKMCRYQDALRESS